MRNTNFFENDQYWDKTYSYQLMQITYTKLDFQDHAEISSFYLTKWKTRTMCEMYASLTRKIPERCHWQCSGGVFIANFEQISSSFLVFPFKTFDGRNVCHMKIKKFLVHFTIKDIFDRKWMWGTLRVSYIHFLSKIFFMTKWT